MGAGIGQIFISSSFWLKLNKVYLTMCAEQVDIWFAHMIMCANHYYATLLIRAQAKNPGGSKFRKSFWRKSMLGGDFLSAKTRCIWQKKIQWVFFGGRSLRRSPKKYALYFWWRNALSSAAEANGGHQTKFENNYLFRYLD